LRARSSLSKWMPSRSFPCSSPPRICLTQRHHGDGLRRDRPESRVRCVASRSTGSGEEARHRPHRRALTAQRNHRQLLPYWHDIGVDPEHRMGG
jgi:hypothetical protein